MSLRKQTLIFFIVSMFCLLGILLIVTSTIFLQGFNEVEQNSTGNTVQMARDIVAADTASLAQLQQDWADGDDTYDFVANKDLDYIQTNLNDLTLARLNLRLLVYLDSQNNIVFGSGIDLLTGKTEALPEGFASYLAPGSPLLVGANSGTNNVVSGLVLLPAPETPLLVVASPILMSNGQGPSHGTLIMARPFDDKTVQNLAKLLHVSLNVERFNASDLPADFRNAKALLSLTDPSPVYFQDLDDQTNGGYTVFKDISGNPALLMRVEVPKQIYQQGQTSLNYLIGFIMLALVLFGGITLFLMERMLIRRVSNLNAEVKQVAVSGDLTTRMEVKGNDEIANLAGVINRMLEALEISLSKERESERRFRLLIEKLPVGVTLHDANSVVQLANQSAAGLLDLSLEELIGKNYRKADWKTIHEDNTDYPQESRPIQQAILTGNPVQNVTMGVYRPKRDDWVWILASVVPAYDDKGKLTNIICSFSDITERKKVEELKTEFVSVVSHELRTPLASILGSLGLINGGVAGEIPPTARHMLGIAYKNSERLLQLINDILDIEKIEAGKMVFHKKPLELSDVIEQAITATQSYAEQYGIVFDYKTKSIDVNKSCKVLSDGDRLNQVLVNLLSNAAKFSPSGGTVEISLDCPDDTTARIAVSDKGPGISKDFQSHVFEKFVQGDSSATRQKGGTGLGLSISKAIVDKLKGQLTFTTVVGEGTTFYLELPLISAPVQIPQASVGGPVGYSG